VVEITTGSGLWVTLEHFSYLFIVSDEEGSEEMK
jgi:hypothetical protein